MAATVNNVINRTPTRKRKWHLAFDGVAGAESTHQFAHGFTVDPNSTVQATLAQSAVYLTPVAYGARPIVVTFPNTTDVLVRSEGGATVALVVEKWHTGTR